ncbi:MAG: tyrosine-type recombinase/integrase [Bacteroidales bacterium]|nr:tyrosine-type recombinase/integrase [Bacteroidales bacterium]
MKMENQTQMFIDHLLNHGHALNTVRAYTQAITQFTRHFAEPSPRNLAIHHEYLIKHYKPQTVNLRILALNKFLTFTGRSQLRLNLIRIQQKSFAENVISFSDYLKLKSRLLDSGNLRWYFMIWTLGATGARISEILQVRIEDILNTYIDLMTKGNKARRIHFPEHLVAEVRQWCARDPHATGYLYINKQGQRISARGFALHLKSFARQFGINPSVIYPHSFRHMYAKTFLSHHADIATLADFLGHANLSTTQIYLRRTLSEQQKLINEVVDW